MSATDGYLMIALFVVPLVAGLLLMITASRERGAIIAITGVASLVMFALSVYLFDRYDYHSEEQFQGVVAWDWMENVGFLGEHGIQFKVGMDGIAAPMVC
jgi:NADH:ubiquinone oxidoreductase subunit 4 (subunit M)